MKKFLNTKFGETIVLTAASVVNLIFTIAFYSVKLTDFFLDSELVRGSGSLWSTQSLYFNGYILRHFNTIFIVAFCVGLLLFAVSALLSFFKNKKWTFYISVAYNLALSLTVLFVNVFCGVLRSGAVACVIVSLLISVATLIFMMVRNNSLGLKTVTVSGSDETTEVTLRNVKPLKIGMLVCECVATLFFILAFFVPVYTETVQDVSTSYYLINALGAADCPLQIDIAFMVMAAACFVLVLCFASAISSFTKNNDYFAVKSQRYMYTATFMSVAFFVLGYALTFYLNLKQGGEGAETYSVKTVSYIPAILSVAVLLVFSVLQGRLPSGAGENGYVAKFKKFKIEPLIYVTVITAVTFASLALTIVSVDVSYSSLGAQFVENVRLNGYELLTNYAELEAGFQLMSFILLAMLLVSGIMLVVSFVSFFAKNNDYYKIIKASAFTNFVFVLAIGLFGIYFKIAQKVNEENLLELLKLYGITVSSTDYISNVSSQGYFAAIASFAMIILMVIRGQFNLSVEPEKIDSSVTIVDDKREEKYDEKREVETPPSAEESKTPDEIENFGEPCVKREDVDVCPAFTELDLKAEQFEQELNVRKENLFNNLTLPNLVRFVVDYARECRLHLSYSLEDMATFVAGLGASRLTILQGMSGTGKTSLPKIFTEAIMGVCDIVEVESSWRDKNELLGYYNEFSKCYTPKIFTQYLYKAGLNPSVPTFIVLDEMNLSRIEYYFSDFLSLMENEEDKRAIKLLNVKLARTVDGQTVPYTGLTDGHTIKIPKNVWFIGTANRDESTFEISDKVYDRAQTMNFNKRAPKIHSFSEPLSQRFASYDMIAKLFKDAKEQYAFDAEENATVKKVEKLLMPYNVSFGNRILRQMEDFVKIYCTCFGDKSAVENDAVEKILLSKVVSKLENKIVENKQALAAEFGKLGLNRCSAFVLKLNED